MNAKQLLEIVQKFWHSISTGFVVVSFIAASCVGMYLVLDYSARANVIEKANISSKLMWNNIGQCYFVQLDDFNKYYRIVRVQDCDKAR
ncbi:MAG: hypothetical protein EBU08_17430 [Micrococcales bacterium]|nr:hypothetical protein [Micrococcales bacterium]